MKRNVNGKCYETGIPIYIRKNVDANSPFGEWREELHYWFSHGEERYFLTVEGGLRSPYPACPIVVPVSYEDAQDYMHDTSVYAWAFSEVPYLYARPEIWNG